MLLGGESFFGLRRGELEGECEMRGADIRFMGEAEQTFKHFATQSAREMPDILKWDLAQDGMNRATKRTRLARKARANFCRALAEGKQQGLGTSVI